MRVNLPTVVSAILPAVHPIVMISNRRTSQSKFRAALPAGLVMVLLTSLCGAVSGRAQQPAAPAAAAPLVDAPRPMAPTSLTLGERFALQAHITFSPIAFVAPAVFAGITMANPPNNYPRDWSDGGGAFGRNYGAELATQTTAGLTHFAVAAIVREDPRYYPCLHHNFGGRVVHALAFTVVDRSSSGHRMIAVSNFAGSAAGGFIGMTYYPDGFNDVTHGYQEAAVELGGFAAHNLAAEFSPELSKLLHKLHLPGGIANSVQAPRAAQP